MIESYGAHNPSPGERVRNFYRQQGAQAERQRIVQELERLLAERQEASWSPKYLIDLINNQAQSQTQLIA
jgi:hypothetical protein